MTRHDAADVRRDSARGEVSGVARGIERRAPNRATFLDRDGVRIEDVGYVHRLTDLEILWENIRPLIIAQRSGYLLIIITNQSGIARGYYTVAEYREFQARVVDRLRGAGLSIAGSYFCPYDERGSVPQYSFPSELRKPRPGMILKAVSDFNIDLKRSYMIGDRDTDRNQFAQLRSFILKGRYPLTSSRDVYHSMQEIWEVTCENP